MFFAIMPCRSSFQTAYFPTDTCSFADRWAHRGGTARVCFQAWSRSVPGKADKASPNPAFPPSIRSACRAGASPDKTKALADVAAVRKCSERSFLLQVTSRLLFFRPRSTAKDLAQPDRLRLVDDRLA